VTRFIKSFPVLFNLHTHTIFSDGSSAPEAYLKEALRQGFSVLGFSDHSPVPFENNFAIKEERLDEYCEAVRKLSPTPVPFPMGEGREGRGITILLGLEIDYIPGVTKSVEYYRKKYQIDYFIGSVHLVKNGNNPGLWFIDGPDISIYDQGLNDFFHRDIRHGVKSYYHQINQMILTQKPDIIGHLDKIKMHNRNRYFHEDESWYIRLVDETLELIKENQCVVEVNTRGIYKKRSDSLYPGHEILKKINAMRIPVTISSDAHKPNELSLYFEEAKKLLSEIGFKSLALITNEGWKEVTLF
jgi:histidinol-phosphatase (PHP family)